MPTKNQAQAGKESTQKQQSKRPDIQGLDAQTEQVNMAVTLQRAKVDPKSLTPRDVLQLQHTIGNRTVSRLLAAQTSTELPIRGAVLNRIQRILQVRYTGGTPLTLRDQQVITYTVKQALSVLDKYVKLKLIDEEALIELESKNQNKVWDSIDHLAVDAMNVVQEKNIRERTR